MNSQKVEQSIKEIWDKCGEEILQNHSAFKSAVLDLLDSINYADERLVLKHAMDSNSFWILLETSHLTSDSAQKAVTQIQKESHMAQEDVEFVVQCVAAARGVNIDMVIQEPEPSGSEDVVILPLSQSLSTSESINILTNGNPTPAQDNTTENTATEYKPQPQPKDNSASKGHTQTDTQETKRGQTPVKEEKPVLDMKCTLTIKNGVKGNEKKRKGELNFYQDKLVFVPYIKNKKQDVQVYEIDTNQSSAIEIFYKNINELISFKRWIYAVYIIFICMVLMGISNGDAGVLIMFVLMYGGNAAMWHLLLRNCMTLKLNMDMDNYGFILPNHDTKNQAVQFLKNQGVLVK